MESKEVQFVFNQGGGRGGGFRSRINEIAQKFRQMGATSPETAKTAEELGLPPRFKDAMNRRLGQTGIFVEVNGRYYLNEARLAQMNQRGLGWQGGGMGMGQRQGIREKLIGLRIARLAITIGILLLIFANLFYFHNPETWILIGVLILLAVAISVLQIYYLSRSRRMRNMMNYP